MQIKVRKSFWQVSLGKSCFWTNKDALSSETLRFYITITSFMSKDQGKYDRHEIKLLNLSQGIQVLTFVIVSPLWAGLWPRRTWGFGHTRRDIECSCTAFPDWSPHCTDNCRKQTHCSLIYCAVLDCDRCHSVSIMTEFMQCKLGRAVAKSLLKPGTNQKQVQDVPCAPCDGSQGADGTWYRHNGHQIKPSR